MAARITDLFPFLLITLLCVGGVEGGYQALEHFILKPHAEKAVLAKPAQAVKNLPEMEEHNNARDYHIILQRNLFGPPPGKGESAPATTRDYTENLQSTSLNIVLMGTINGGEKDSRAIILDKSSNKQDLYEVGDTIQGAAIKEILRGKVILAFNGKDEMLDMSDAAKERSANAAPGARAGAGGKQSAVGAASRAGRQRSLNRPAVPPRGNPGRVISRPRTIRPSRSIITE